MESLEDRIEKYQMQMGQFTDLCQYIMLTHDHIAGVSGYEIILASVLSITAQEAQRVKKMSDELIDSLDVTQGTPHNAKKENGDAALLPEK